MRIGVISDTHGLLRPEAVHALAGCAHILHAGDVGNDEILGALRTIAPLTAIRGNVDHVGACSRLPATETIELDGKLIYMLHAREDLDLHPHAAGITAVIFGHSHQPEISWANGVLFFNPGSAGPRRFSLPVTLGFLECSSDTLTPSIIPLLP
ncbi:MAG TPA: metallophosphoesterase family protein [Acidobacteriaceae bacterium]|nr:metallophosphoesterase family protein [Acidobacteriaceae bacterium]